MGRTFICVISIESELVQGIYNDDRTVWKQDVSQLKSNVAHQCHSLYPHHTHTHTLKTTQHMFSDFYTLVSLFPACSWSTAALKLHSSLQDGWVTPAVMKARRPLRGWRRLHWCVCEWCSDLRGHTGHLFPWSQFRPEGTGTLSVVTTLYDWDGGGKTTLI